MISSHFQNLAKIGVIKAEPRSQAEIDRLIRLAQIRLQDAQQTDVSIETRFLCAYSAAHAAALAALRHHGYRSENRFTVFQCLTHTMKWQAPQWRIFDVAHQKRNLSEYEGYSDVHISFVEELIESSQHLINDVNQLVR